MLALSLFACLNKVSSSDSGGAFLHLSPVMEMTAMLGIYLWSLGCLVTCANIQTPILSSV